MIAKVTFFNTLRKLFDYHIPERMVAVAKIGLRVKVPFGRKLLIGFIVEINKISTIAENKLKSIEELIDTSPLLDQSLYTTILWAADYYKHSMGGILDLVLPRHVKENRAIKIKDLKIENIITDKTTPNLLGAKPEDNLTLNPYQQHAIQAILADNNEFNVNCLEGVTGSGKTEVYLQLTANMLAIDKQVLVLIPEIGLTPQTLQRFRNRFHDTEIVVLHSRLSPKQRSLNWNKARQGLAKIILGTRTAAFVPLANPGLFIIDEEHDLSFQQQYGVNYNARNFLIMRAKHANCQIVLGSATLSLESMHNVLINKYRHYLLPKRAKSELPVINIIDTRNKKLKLGLSEQTIAMIKNSLTIGQQVLLFINRRGFAPVLQCSNCKWIYKCNSCDANMILHIYSNKLQCHHCHVAIPVAYICGKCSQPRLLPVGQGTERVESAVKRLFPEANIARIDRDSAGGKDSFEEMLAKILQQKINLLIGTQMLAKGHHFPNVGLAVIIDVDYGFFSNDFRSTERLGQLILQVAGRAGREYKGEVLLETKLPNHPLLLAIQQHDYAQFCRILLTERQDAELPPFSHQILWKAQAKLMHSCMQFLQQIKILASKILMENKLLRSQIKSFGPFPANMEKRKNKFHARLLFQSTNRKQLQQLHDLIVETIEKNHLHKIAKKVQWNINVDPQEF